MLPKLSKEKQKKLAEERKQHDKLVAKQREDLLKLILKKADMTKKDVVDFALQEFVVSNLDLLTAEEKKQFTALVL